MDAIARLKEALCCCHDGNVTREIVEEIVRASMEVQAAGGIADDELTRLLYAVPTNYDLAEEI